MKLAANTWWCVCTTDGATIPVDDPNKVQVETVMGNPECLVVYFTDIHGGAHIVMRSSLSRIEYSDPGLRQAIAKDSVLLEIDRDNTAKSVYNYLAEIQSALKKN